MQTNKSLAMALVYRCRIQGSQSYHALSRNTGPHPIVVARLPSPLVCLSHRSRIHALFSTSPSVRGSGSQMLQSQCCADVHIIFNEIQCSALARTQFRRFKKLSGLVVVLINNCECRFFSVCSGHYRNLFATCGSVQ